MSLIRVPEDQTLAKALSTEQVHMVIIGSIDPAPEVAKWAGEVAERAEYGSESPRAAIWIADETLAADDLERIIGKPPYPLVTVLDFNNKIAMQLGASDDIDRIVLDQAFLKGGA